MSLPVGWIRESVVRKKGISKGKVDIYIRSPKGKIFRSKKELERHIIDNRLSLDINKFDFRISSKKKEHEKSNNSPTGDNTNASLISSDVSMNVESVVLEVQNDSDVLGSSTPKNCKEIISNQSNSSSVASYTEKTPYVNDSVAATCLSILNREWLSDDSIRIYFEVFSLKVAQDPNIHFMNPVIAQALKCLSDTDHIVDQLELYKKSYIFIPINDATAIDSSGSHWSLLVFVKKLNKCFYFDSLDSYNHDSAVTVANSLNAYLDQTCVMSVEKVSVPKQLNHYDCGVYLILFTEIVLQHIQLNRPWEELRASFPIINGNDLLTKRAQISLVVCNSKHFDFASKEALTAMMIKPADIVSKHHNNEPTNIKPKTYNIPKEDRFQGNNPQDWKTVEAKSHSRLTNAAFSPPLKNKYQLISGKLDCNETTNEQNKRPSPVKNKLPKPERYLLTSQSMDNAKRNKKQKDLKEETGKKISIKPIINKKVSQSKIYLVSDSQGRSMVYHLDNLLSDHFSISSTVLPGAPLEYVLETATSYSDLDSLSANDYVIFIGGGNNVSNGMVSKSTLSVTESIKLLETRIEMFSHTNLILGTIPYRYDLNENCRVNKSIVQGNLMIRQITYSNPNIHLLDLNILERRYQTRHGMHINREGKRYVSKLIKNIIMDNTSSPVMSWRTPGNFEHNQHLVRVVEDNMLFVVQRNSSDKSLAFAHSISSEIGESEIPSQNATQSSFPTASHPGLPVVSISDVGRLLTTPNEGNSRVTENNLSRKTSSPCHKKGRSPTGTQPLHSTVQCQLPPVTLELMTSNATDAVEAEAKLMTTRPSLPATKTFTDETIPFSPNQSGKVEVVPGVLTFSETLKKSNGYGVGGVACVSCDRRLLNI